MTDFEKLFQTNQDADIYDSEADDEAEELEHALDKEKRLQVKWKVEHRKATEAHDKRTIVSQQVIMEKFLALATQLNYSEKMEWHEMFRKIDRAQSECTEFWFTHYFMNNGRPMQRGQDPLYSHWKQSMWKRFSKELLQVKWADWESMSEFDTDCDTWAEVVTKELQTRVEMLQSLQEQQLPGDTTAQIVAQVVLPVAATVPVPEVVTMDTSAVGAGPAPTMGPGQPATGMEMLFIFGDDDDEQWEQEEQRQLEEEEVEQAAQMHGHFRHPMDAMDDGNFDNAVEM